MEGRGSDEVRGRDKDRLEGGESRSGCGSVRPLSNPQLTGAGQPPAHRSSQSRMGCVSFLLVMHANQVDKKTK